MIVRPRILSPYADALRRLGTGALRLTVQPLRVAPYRSDPPTTHSPLPMRWLSPVNSLTLYPMHDRYVIAVQEMLGTGETGHVSVRIAGDCMAPGLVDGQRVLLKQRRWYWPGDILVYHSPSGNGLIAHRLIGAGWRRGRWRLLTQADNAPRPDFALPPGRVLGRVVEPAIAPRQRLAAVARFLAFAWGRLRRR